MPTDDRQVIVTGQAPAPAQWVIPGNGQIRPVSVFAHYDGTGAASPFVPALKVVSDGGKTVGIYPTAPSVAAGGSADVSWFPGSIGPVSAAKVAVVGARIEMHATQNVSSSTATNLTYDTVVFDTAGMTNLVADNRKINVVASGLYLVISERAWPYNNSGERQLAILYNAVYPAAVNNADDSRPAIWANNVGAGGQTTNFISALIKASVGDFFASGATQDSGSTLTTGGGPAEFFSAILLGTA